MEKVQEFFRIIGRIFYEFIKATGFANIELTNLIMILIALVLIFLAIVKKFEPYLLIPIAVGMLLVNFPMTDLYNKELKEGLFYYLHEGLVIYPSLIFLGIGATTDFGPLIANPKSMLLGAAAQLGIFITFIGAIALGFNGLEASAIGIIGGADGPTAIFVSSAGGEKDILRGLHGLPLHNCFSVPSFQKVDTSHFVLEGINVKKCDGKEYSYQ